MSRAVIFSLFWLIVPTDFVRAIPPPDLIISTAQAVFATVGLIASSLFIWWSQVWTWLTLNKNNKFIFLFGLIVFFITSSFLYTQFLNTRDTYYRKQIDKEIEGLWFEYEPVYIAENEETARLTSLDISHGVSWNDFLKATDGNDYLVVDIRDIYGYQSGHIRGSINIRFGDLINGDWSKLMPFKDKPIYIVCFLGSTGALAINFLESKGFTKLYQPPNGIRVAVRSELDIPFEGSTNAFGPERVSYMLNYSQFKNLLLNKDVRYIDMRAPSHYENQTPVESHFRLFREFMRTEDIENFLDSLDKTYEYVAICDSSASCYQGELVTRDLLMRNVKAVGVVNLNKINNLI